ncbi:carboxypeptidase regulatory-like domain-containing protein, partial [bacterium]|nr:carboxypeptidase regulatory-like domain-containing protein [bacterium]
MIPVTKIPTQSNGNYELNLLPGNYTIWAEKNNFLCPDSISVQIQAGQQIPNQNIIMVPNEATITGLTHRPDGTLLRWVDILVEDVLNPSNTTSIVTGANGQFAVIVTPGSQYEITATKNGYSTGNDITANLDVGETYTCDFSMSSLPSLLIGRIVNNLGENLSEVNISLTNEGNPENSTSAQSGLNGKYSTGIAHGAYSATAQLLGHLEESKEIEIVPGVTDTLSFVLVQNFSTLHGTITDDQDQNLKGVMITATRSSGGGGTTQTDEIGQYSILDLLPGSYNITISKSDYESSVENNKVIPAGVSIKQDAQLEMYSSSLQVTVNQAETKFAGATISIENQSTGETVSDVTNSSGIGDFTGLLANVEYVVTANAVNYYAEPQTITLNPGQEGTLEFALLLMNSQIFGAIVFQESGSDIGLSGVNIYVLSSDGFSGNATSNADGTFSVQNLNPGREYQITLVKTDYTDVDRNPVNLTEESQSVGTLYMIPNNRKINGIVEDQQGAVFENIPVRAVSDNASGEATTNSSGEFTISGLAPLSSYTVSTNKEEQGWTNVEKQVEIEDSENNSAGTLQITINDARIFGTIKDSSTDGGIIGATIILTNDTTGVTVTKKSQPPDGNYSLKYLT